MLTFLKKRFKKIRITDYLLLLLLVPLIIFAVFYFKREKTYVYIDLTFQREGWQAFPEPPEYWKVNAVKVGDAVYNSLGNQIATVSDVETTVFSGGARTSIEVQLRAQVVYDTRTRKYVMDGKPLLIGDQLTVDFGTSKFKGEIKNIYLNLEDRYKGYRKAKAVIKVKYREIDPWVAENLKNFVEVNSKNEVVARVTAVEVQPAEMMVSTDDGRAVKAEHPFKQDAILTLELPRVLCLGTACFFNNYDTFMIGSGFWADNGRMVIQNASVMEVQLQDSEW